MKTHGFGCFLVGMGVFTSCFREHIPAIPSSNQTWQLQTDGHVAWIHINGGFFSTQCLITQNCACLNLVGGVNTSEK